MRKFEIAHLVRCKKRNLIGLLSNFSLFFPFVNFTQRFIYYSVTEYGKREVKRTHEWVKCWNHRIFIENEKLGTHVAAMVVGPKGRLIEFWPKGRLIEYKNHLFMSAIDNTRFFIYLVIFSLYIYIELTYFFFMFNTGICSSASNK